MAETALILSRLTDFTLIKRECGYHPYLCSGVDMIFSDLRNVMNEPKNWLKERLGNILLATDLHQNSQLALRYAAHLSHTLESKLRSLYVFEYGPYGQSVEAIDHVPSRDRTDAQAALEKFVYDAGYEDITSQVVVEETFVTTAILKTLREQDIDLLVIGTEGVHAGLEHLLLGSNTESLMLGAQRPILTVGPQVPEITEKEIRYQKVLSISDFSLASTAAVQYAFALGETFGVEVDVYQLVSKTAAKDLTQLKRTAAQYCDLLRFADNSLPGDWYDIDYQLSRIVAEDDLASKVSEPSNLLVLGVQPASFLQRHLRASLAYRLLADSKSPVMTVPANYAGR